MLNSSIAVLILLPALGAMVKERELRRSILKPSAVGFAERPQAIADHRLQLEAPFFG
jgi:hypothetical protein